MPNELRTGLIRTIVNKLYPEDEVFNGIALATLRERAADIIQPYIEQLIWAESASVQAEIRANSQAQSLAQEIAILRNQLTDIKYLAKKIPIAGTDGPLRELLILASLGPDWKGKGELNAV